MSTRQRIPRPIRCTTTTTRERDAPTRARRTELLVRPTGATATTVVFGHTSHTHKELSRGRGDARLSLIAEHGALLHRPRARARTHRASRPRSRRRTVCRCRSTWLSHTSEPSPSRGTTTCCSWSAVVGGRPIDQPSSAELLVSCCRLELANVDGTQGKTQRLIASTREIETEQERVNSDRRPEASKAGDCCGAHLVTPSPVVPTHCRDLGHLGASCVRHFPVPDLLLEEHEHCGALGGDGDRGACSIFSGQIQTGGALLGTLYLFDGTAPRDLLLKLSTPPRRPCRRVSASASTRGERSAAVVKNHERGQHEAPPRQRRERERERETKRKEKREKRKEEREERSANFWGDYERESLCLCG
jgi:hypothetical protein